MRNIVLTIVVIVVLAAAGIGGTLATWSDSEKSLGNEIQTGSLDLKVNGQDDAPWGQGVPAKIEEDHVVPGKCYGPYEVDLWHAGQCDWPADAFIHIKNADCRNIPPKVDASGNTTGYVCPVTGDLKPEPELVAEFGGYVDDVEVPGVGIQGDNCCLADYITIWIYVVEDGTCVVDGLPLRDIICSEIWLTQLIPCQPKQLEIYFRLNQPSEEDFDLNLIPHPDEIGPFPSLTEYYEALLYWQKFNDWPSASLMKDAITFDMEFDLVLFDPPETPSIP